MLSEIIVIIIIMEKIINLFGRDWPFLRLRGHFRVNSKSQTNFNASSKEIDDY